jgi:hypothetical protein
MRTGDRVVIERDERKYPSRGTWPQFRGRTGTVVQTNLGEYGVVFGKVAPRTDGRGAFRFEGTVTWFQPHELRPCGKAPESNSDGAGGIGKVGGATPQRKRISEPF